MVSLITGRKGSGKTKRLIEQVNKAVEASSGNVVCVEKERLLTYDINIVRDSSRLISTRSAVQGVLRLPQRYLRR